MHRMHTSLNTENDEAQKATLRQNPVTEKIHGFVEAAVGGWRMFKSSSAREACSR